MGPPCDGQRLASFHGFCHLPAEIQLAIWRHATQHPRLLRTALTNRIGAPSISMQPKFLATADLMAASKCLRDLALACTDAHKIVQKTFPDLISVWLGEKKKLIRLDAEAEVILVEYMTSRGLVNHHTYLNLTLEPSPFKIIKNVAIRLCKDPEGRLETVGLGGLLTTICGYFLLLKNFYLLHTCVEGIPRNTLDHTASQSHAVFNGTREGSDHYAAEKLVPSPASSKDEFLGILHGLEDQAVQGGGYGPNIQHLNSPVWDKSHLPVCQFEIFQMFHCHEPNSYLDMASQASEALVGSSAALEFSKPTVLPQDVMEEEATEIIYELSRLIVNSPGFIPETYSIDAKAPQREHTMRMVRRGGDWPQWHARRRRH